MAGESKWQWLTTSPNPRSSAAGYDAGQRGWRLHAVQATDDETFEAVGKRRASCGLRPRHGWSLDLFIERKCEKCCAKVGLPRPPEAVNEDRFK